MVVNYSVLAWGDLDRPGGTIVRVAAFNGSARGKFVEVKEITKFLSELR